MFWSLVSTVEIDNLISLPLSVVHYVPLVLDVPSAVLGPSDHLFSISFTNVPYSGKVPHRPASPLDPLLAALVSIFIICTAMVSAVLFLRFRQRSEHPEFHRLQDLPMVSLGTKLSWISPLFLYSILYESNETILENTHLNSVSLYQDDLLEDTPLSRYSY